MSIFNCLRRRWSFSESFLTRQHNMFYSLLDTTSLWILATWLSKGSPNKMRGPRLLSHLCNAVVVGNSWRRLRHLPGPSGFPARITASEYLKLHMQPTASTDADPAFQGDVVPSPPGGIKGTGRHSLDHLASTLGFFCSAGNNSHHIASAFYVEHAFSESEATWTELAGVKKLPTSTARSTATLEILSRRMHLRGLCATQVARFLEPVPYKSCRDFCPRYHNRALTLLKRIRVP